MIDIDDVPMLWAAYRARWQDRDNRMDIMTSVLKGDWTAADPNGDAIENRSPNMIQVGIEDTAESASLIPSVRVDPSSPSSTNQKKAAAMERMALSYLDISGFELLILQSNMDLCSRGFYCWNVKVDEETKSPIIERRDPRTVYPGDSWRPGDLVRHVIVARQVHASDLPQYVQDKIQASMLARFGIDVNTIASFNQRILLCEVYDEDETVIAALYQTTPLSTAGRADSFRPVEIDRWPNPGGICPIVIAQRLNAADTEPRGQFDQVIPIMQAHIKLMGLSLDYSDQAVYSDIWVKDLIGKLPYGGGSYIQLGANGEIGRVAPAVSSLTVQQDLQALVDAIHLAGRWPKSRPGEIDQAIASAKFLEATAGMMNTVIRTYHLINQRAMSQALRLCFKADLECGDDRTISGIQKNQQFLERRSIADIDPDAKVHVEYGVGLGRDPSQSAVMGIQMFQGGVTSLEWVQENTDGLTNVQKEQRRLLRSEVVAMMKSKMLMDVQGGALSGDALVNIIEGIDKGDDLVQLYKEFVVKPAAAAPAPMASGLGGLAPPSGPEQPAPGAPQGAPPPPPNAGGMLAGLQSQSRMETRLPSHEGFMSTSAGG